MAEGLAISYHQWGISKILIKNRAMELLHMYEKSLVQIFVLTKIAKDKDKVSTFNLQGAT